MKPVPIPMKQWLAANERTRVLPGDQWYLNFSASILSLVKQGCGALSGIQRWQTFIIFCYL